MSDWIGLLFLIFLASGAYFGLKILAKPQKRTEAEFEKRAAEGAGTLGAGLFALQKLLNPEAAKAHEVLMDVKGGRYDKKKREGKANGRTAEGEEQENNEPESN